MRPNDEKAYSNLGGLLTMLERFDEAELVLRRALEIKPDLAEARYTLGVCLYNNQKRVPAKIELQKAKNLFERKGSEKLVKEIDELLKKRNFD